MKNILNKQKGVTLIALVVTIMVLIILAAVVIGDLNGENSIIKRALGVKSVTTIEQGREQLIMMVNDALDQGNGILLKENLVTEINGKYQIEDDNESGWIVTIDSNRFHISEEGNVTVKSN